MQKTDHEYIHVLTYNTQLPQLYAYFADAKLEAERLLIEARRNETAITELHIKRYKYSASGYVDDGTDLIVYVLEGKAY